MPRKAPEMKPLQVSRLTKPGFHAVGGVPGLSLRVRSPDCRSWILRTKVGNRVRDIGLGGYPEVSLADARQRAREAKEIIRAGGDPVEQRRAARDRLIAEQNRAMTFERAALEAIPIRTAGLKQGGRSAEIWESSLRLHAFPKIGALPVADINREHVLSVLKPLWTDKPETARRLRTRIEAVLDYAATRDARSGDNPAKWKGNLEHVLPRVNGNGNSFAALPYEEMPDFMLALSEVEGQGARALELLILTATRSGEVRKAEWSEFDLEKALWDIPAERMKMKRRHLVPLSGDAVRLLESLPRIAGSPLVFPSSRGTPISDMTISAVCRRMGVKAVPHGFRSTFRTWGSEQTNAPLAVLEMALAHGIGDKTQAAYDRATYMEQRRELMEQWGEFINSRVHFRRRQDDFHPVFVS